MIHLRTGRMLFLLVALLGGGCAPELPDRVTWELRLFNPFAPDTAELLLDGEEVLRASAVSVTGTIKGPSWTRRSSTEEEWVLRISAPWGKADIPASVQKPSEYSLRQAIERDEAPRLHIRPDLDTLPTARLFIDNRGREETRLGVGRITLELSADDYWPKAPCEGCALQHAVVILLPTSTEDADVVIDGRAVGSLPLGSTVSSEGAGPLYLLDMSGARQYRLRRVTYSTTPLPRGPGELLRRSHLHEIGDAPPERLYFLRRAPESVLTREDFVAALEVTEIR